MDPKIWRLSKSMERQSFWWRTTAPEFSGFGSSFFGLRGFAMACGNGSILCAYGWQLVNLSIHAGLHRGGLVIYREILATDSYSGSWGQSWWQCALALLFWSGPYTWSTLEFDGAFIVLLDWTRGSKGNKYRVSCEHGAFQMGLVFLTNK